jgi:hypothetical protein
MDVSKAVAYSFREKITSFEWDGLLKLGSCFAGLRCMRSVQGTERHLSESFCLADTRVVSFLSGKPELTLIYCLLVAGMSSALLSILSLMPRFLK